MEHIARLQNSLGLSEVAELVGRDERTVRRWHAAGDLPAYRIARELRFPREGVEAFLAAALVAPDTAEGESQAVA